MIHIYERLLGSHWIYEGLRPFVVGGLNYSIAYEYIECKADDIIVDVGCGMGDALNYLRSFCEYHGFDIDTRGVEHLRRKTEQQNIFVYNRTLTAEDLLRVKPNKGILIGLLHHLQDKEVLDLLEALSVGGFIKRIVTFDPVYIKGRFFNNLLPLFDRGRYVRTGQGYESLIAKSKFMLLRRSYIESGNGWAKYFITDLRPNR